MSQNCVVNNNDFQIIFKEYSEKIISNVVEKCANIHNFDFKETMNILMNIKNDNDDETRVDIPIQPVAPKKKRGRPKKIKNETVSNSYNEGTSDPIFQKLLTAMKTNNNKSNEIITDDELLPDKPIEDEEDIETTLFEYKGAEYLLSNKNDLYENIGDNAYVGKWDPDSQSIIS